jgi:DNA-binding transcriptional MerR regulator
MKIMELIELAERTHIPVSTLRYFEALNLVSAVVHLDGQRDYDEHSLHQVQWIRRAQKLGFKLEEIQQLINLRQHVNCAKTLSPLFSQKIRALDEQINGLQQQRRTLFMLMQQFEHHPYMLHEGDHLAWFDQL